MSCDGECLTQYGISNKYISINCPNEIKCEPLKCPNYNLCGATFPERLSYSCERLCFDCDVYFGPWKNGKRVLKQYENNKCHNCSKNKLCFEQPICKHKICKACYNIIYFGNIDDIIELKIGKEPEHPYNVDGLDYDDYVKYPLMVEYNKRINIYDNLKEAIENKMVTGRCPTCYI